MSEFPHYSALSLRLSDEPDPAWKVHSIAVNRKAAGEDVIVLSIGEPDSPPPPAVLAEIEASIARGRTRYSNARGEDNVIEAICRYTSKQAGRTIEPDMVNFFPGAQTALFGMLMTIVGPGDGLIVPEPFYAPYAQVLGATGVEVGHIALKPEHGFHPSIDELRAAITPRTRAMVITNPHNPTGAVLTRDELTAIAELCREHDMWLVADEVYNEFIYTGEFTSILALEGYEDRTIALGTLSSEKAAFRALSVVASDAFSGATACIKAARSGRPEMAGLADMLRSIADRGYAVISYDATDPRIDLVSAHNVGGVVCAVSTAPGSSTSSACTWGWASPFPPPQAPRSPVARAAPSSWWVTARSR